MTNLLPYLVAALFLVLAGFAWGRRLGREEGAAAARAAAPLELRAETLESGRCPVCATPHPAGPVATGSPETGGQ